jgi:hypothetical protein
MKPIYLVPILLLAGCAKHNASTQPYVDTTPQADIESLINAEAERLYAVFRAPKEARADWGPKPKTDGKGFAIAIKDSILRTANDPTSIEFVDCSEPKRVNVGWMQVVQFRGKNGFGAKVTNAVGYSIYRDQILGEIEDKLIPAYVEDAQRIEAEDKADWDLAIQTATVTVKAKFKKP